MTGYVGPGVHPISPENSSGSPRAQDPLAVTLSMYLARGLDHEHFLWVRKK